jgi:hypothetical protein
MWLLVPAALLCEADADLRRPLVVGPCLLAPLLCVPFGWARARATGARGSPSKACDAAEQGGQAPGPVDGRAHVAREDSKQQPVI